MSFEEMVTRIYCQLLEEEYISPREDDEVKDLKDRKRTERAIKLAKQLRQQVLIAEQGK